jgi:hypothetical protein
MAQVLDFLLPGEQPIIEPQQQQQRLPRAMNRRKRLSGNKDELTRRFRIGRRGSRRHRRWLNEEFLGREDPTFDSGMQYDSDLYPEDYGSFFAEILADPESMRALEPFLDTTEEEQNRLLGIDILQKPQQTHNRKNGTGGPTQLDWYTRELLFDQIDDPFVIELDDLLHSFLGVSILFVCLD